MPAVHWYIPLSLGEIIKRQDLIITMKIENPLAFSFIMQDEIYLLNKDRQMYAAGLSAPAIAAPVLETPETRFNYLGKHKKRFLILTHYPGLEFMAENHLAALESTLKRLEFSLDDVAVFNLASSPDVTFEHLSVFFKPQLLLILGQSALPGGIGALELNKRLRLNSCTTLFTFSFNEMMESNENKKAFWEQMKQL